MSIKLDGYQLPGVAHLLDRIVNRYFEPVVPRCVARCSGGCVQNVQIARNWFEDLVELRLKPRITDK